LLRLNRIFGYDAWDRCTIATSGVWSGTGGAYHGAAYTARVRVSVRTGELSIVREGSGTGEGKAPTPGQAHELALKAAETDATKSPCYFRNPFGLARGISTIRMNCSRMARRQDSLTAAVVTVQKYPGRN
jgi:hypothetical protein